MEHLNGMEVCGRAVGVVRSQAHTQLFIGGCVSLVHAWHCVCALR